MAKKLFKTLAFDRLVRNGFGSLAMGDPHRRPRDGQDAEDAKDVSGLEESLPPQGEVHLEHLRPGDRPQQDSTQDSALLEL